MATARLTVVSPARPETPSSLTQRGAADQVCVYCGSPRVTSLAMTLTDGTPAQFVSCHVCEQRSWSAEGRSLPLTDVIKRTTKVKAS